MQTLRVVRSAVRAHVSAASTLWGACCIILASVGVYEYVQIQQSLRIMAARESSLGSVREALARASMAGVHAVGRELPLDRLSRMDEATPTDAPAAIPRLLLVLDAEVCHVCEERELAFLLETAGRLDKDHVGVIYVAKDVRAVIRYAEAYGRSLSIWHDALNVLKESGLPPGVALLVTDGGGRILAAHYPLPTEQAISEAFHAAAIRLAWSHQIEGGKGAE